MPAEHLNDLLTEELLQRQLARRQLLRRAIGIGLSAPMVAGLLAACADDDGEDDSGDSMDMGAGETETTGGTTATEPAGAGEEEDATAPADAQATQGGTFTFAMLGDPTLNVFTWPGQLPTILVAKNVFSTLVKYSAEDGFTLVPDLATAWSASDDGLTWTFELRDDVQWHDGEPFTAEDVKFTLEGILSPDVRAQFAAALSGVTSVEVPNPTTVTVTSEEPIGSLSILLAYNIAIAPKHILEGQDLNDLSDFVQAPVGTGPFTTREIVSGDRVVLDAYENYHEGRPNIDSMIYKVVPDINSVVAQLRTGELDMAVVEPSNMEALGDADLNFVTALEPNTFTLYLNNAQVPFDDVRVRRALTMAIDRQAIVDQLLLGEAIMATSSHSPAFGDYYNDQVVPFPYDVEAAAGLMEEAGWTKDGETWTRDGQPLTFGLMVDKGNPTREQLALVVQQFWQDFGAEVTVDVQEWSVYIERGSQRPGDYDTRTGWRITAPDPDKTAEYHSEGANNHYGYSNPEVDQLLSDARAETDHDARVALYHELQQMLYDDCPVCWLYYPNSILAVNKRVRGLPEIGVRDALLYIQQISLA